MSEEIKSFAELGPEHTVDWAKSHAERRAESQRRIYYLFYNSDDGRYWRHSYGLHCGDGLEVQIEGQWVHTRIEHSSSSTHSHGWLLVTHPNQPLEDLPVRKERQ